MNFIEMTHQSYRIGSGDALFTRRIVTSDSEVTAHNTLVAQNMTRWY